MSKSVSNIVLWEKSSEIDERLNRCLMEKKKTVPGEEQAEIAVQLKENKDQIVALFKKGLQGLGSHCDSHCKAMYGHIKQLEKGNKELCKVLTYLYRKIEDAENHPDNKVESKPESDKSFLNFKLFKVWKFTIVIAMLGLLVLTFALFCMKQQNDYTILIRGYYRQSVITRELQMKLDSLKNIHTNQNTKKK